VGGRRREEYMQSPKRKKEYDDKYYVNHREEILAKKREYSRKYPDRVKDARNKNYHKNRHKAIEAAANYKFMKKIDERQKIYIEDQKFWNERMRKHFKGNQADIAIRYFDPNHGRSLEVVGEYFGLSLERVRQIVSKALFFILMQSKRKDVQEALKQRRKKQPSKNKLLQEEFDRIKSLLWEGTPHGDIASLVERSDNVVGRVEQAETLEEYFKKASDHHAEWYKERRRESNINRERLQKRLHILPKTKNEKRVKINYEIHQKLKSIAEDLDTNVKDLVEKYITEGLIRDMKKLQDQVSSGMLLKKGGHTMAEDTTQEVTTEGEATATEAEVITDAPVAGSEEVGEPEATPVA
jgi:hypothetical protein